MRSYTIVGRMSDEDVADNWEDVKDSDLDKRVQQIVNANRVSPVNQHFTPPPRLHEETSRTTYQPRVQILKRTEQQAAGDSTNANRVQPRGRVKTLEEREAAYAEARLRIMGSASDSEQPPAGETRPQPLSDRLVALDIGGNVMRQPQGPDGSRGFSPRLPLPS